MRTAVRLIGEGFYSASKWGISLSRIRSLRRGRKEQSPVLVHAPDSATQKENRIEDGHLTADAMHSEAVQAALGESLQSPDVVADASYSNVEQAEA